MSKALLKAAAKRIVKPRHVRIVDAADKVRGTCNRSKPFKGKHGGTYRVVPYAATLYDVVEIAQAPGRRSYSDLSLTRVEAENVVARLLSGDLPATQPAGSSHRSAC